MRLVWVVQPHSGVVTVHRPRVAQRRLTLADELDGEDVLPGFRLLLRELFGRGVAD